MTGGRQCLGCGHVRGPLPASAASDHCPKCFHTGWRSPPDVASANVAWPAQVKITSTSAAA